MPMAIHAHQYVARKSAFEGYITPKRQHASWPLPRADAISGPERRHAAAFWLPLTFPPPAYLHILAAADDY